jgi:hypothetical protein
MNPANETGLRQRARRAYEWSRAGNALALGALVAAPAAMASMGCGATPAPSVVGGLGLGSTIALARFVGMRSQAALRPGLLGGLLAFAFPLVCHLFMCPGGMCRQGGMEWMPYVAIVAAFAGGIAIRLFSRDGSPLVAGSTALLLGSLGSLAAGLEGPLLTAAGLALGGILPLNPVRRGSAS